MINKKNYNMKKFIKTFESFINEQNSNIENYLTNKDGKYFSSTLSASFQDLSENTHTKGYLNWDLIILELSNDSTEEEKSKWLRRSNDFEKNYGLKVYLNNIGDKYYFLMINKKSEIFNEIQTLLSNGDKNIWTIIKSKFNLDDSVIKFLSTTFSS